MLPSIFIVSVAIDFSLPFEQSYLVWPTAARVCNASPRKCKVPSMLLSLHYVLFHPLSISIVGMKYECKGNSFCIISSAYFYPEGCGRGGGGGDGYKA